MFDAFKVALLVLPLGLPVILAGMRIVLDQIDRRSDQVQVVQEEV